MSPRTIHEDHILYTSFGRLDVREGVAGLFVWSIRIAKERHPPLEYYTNQIKYTAHEDFPAPQRTSTYHCSQLLSLPLGP